MSLKELGLKKIYVDLKNDNIGELFAKEGEKNSRGLDVTILNNGVVADTTGVEITLYTEIKGNIYEKEATTIDSSKGNYEILYPTNMLKGGRAKAELRMTSSDAVLATRTFTIDIENSIIGDDAIEGADEEGLLDKLLEAGKNEQERILAETERTSSEKDRKSSENERQSNESVRVENETERVSNENTRQSNEVTRVDQEEGRETTFTEFKGDWESWFDEVQNDLSEDARIVAEEKRVASEEARELSEEDRVAQESDRSSQEEYRVGNEETRLQSEVDRAGSEVDRVSSEETRVSEEVLRKELYEQVKSDYKEGRFKGDKGEAFVYSDFTEEQIEELKVKGDKGDSLEFEWQDTKLGIKKDYEEDFTFTDLKGEKGEGINYEDLSPEEIAEITGPRGEPGRDGTDAEVTNENVITAIGYTPLRDEDISGKVDKVAGKSLSDNNYTTPEKNKLVGIDEKANNYSHPGKHPASIITETSSKKFVSDAEKSDWNSKASAEDLVTTNTNLSNLQGEVSTHEADYVQHGKIGTKEVDESEIDDKATLSYSAELGKWVVKRPLDDTSGSPGPSNLIGGDMQAGYFGIVPAAELYTGDELATNVGITQGTSQFSNEGWLKFAIDGKIIYKSKKTFRHSISWDDIDSKGCVDGTKTVTKDGTTYEVTLMKGGDGNASDAVKGPKASEWNKLMLPIHAKAEDQSWKRGDNVDTPTEDWGVGFTDADLQTHYDHGDGTRHWCQEVYHSSTSSRISRGSIGVSESGSSSPSSTGADYGWSPVLRVIE